MDDEDEVVEKVEEKAGSMHMKKPSHSLSNHISTDGMSVAEKTSLANREKDKGNEVSWSHLLFSVFCYVCVSGK